MVESLNASWQLVRVVVTKNDCGRIRPVDTKNDGGLIRAVVTRTTADKYNDGVEIGVGYERGPMRALQTARVFLWKDV